MHRSGTSLAASLLQQLGVDMGPRVLEPDQHNPLGYFEDREFLELQGRMLLAATPENDGGHPDWGWTEHELLDRGAFESQRSAAAALIRARAERGAPWGWKNPRTTLQLDFWDSLLQGGRYLLLYRFPWEVADSMQRLGAAAFLRRPDYAYRIWEYYNRSLLDFLDRAGDRAVLISANAMVTQPGRVEAVLRDRLGLEVPDGVVGERLRLEAFRSSAYQRPLVELLSAARPSSLALLAELDRRADLPSPAGAAAPAIRHAATRSARISVVIPCFNHGEFLLEAVASVEAQELREPLELVIVNDGSTESRSLEVLEQLRGLGYRVLDQPNLGLARARNAGATASTGIYLLPLDADNRLRPGFAAAALVALDREPRAGVFYSDRFDFGLRQGVVRVPELDAELLLRGNYIDACAVLRRGVWEECHGWDPNMPTPGWEDWDLWIAAMGRGWRFVHWPEVGYDYRVRPDSMATGCADAEAGSALQEYIVRKHVAVYTQYLPQLLRAAQEFDRTASAARAELSSTQLLLAVCQETGKRIDAHREVVVAERDDFSSRLDRLTQDYRTLRAEFDRIADHRQRLIGERDEFAARLEHLAHDYRSLRGELDRLGDHRQRLIVERDDFSTRLNRLTADYRTLEERLQISEAALADQLAEQTRLAAELEFWRSKVAFMESRLLWRLRSRVAFLARRARASVAAPKSGPGPGS